MGNVFSYSRASKHSSTRTHRLSIRILWSEFYQRLSLATGMINENAYDGNGQQEPIE
jgi:hypothetical protein